MRVIRVVTANEISYTITSLGNVTSQQVKLLHDI